MGASIGYGSGLGCRNGPFQVLATDFRTGLRLRLSRERLTGHFGLRCGRARSAGWRPRRGATSWSRRSVTGPRGSTRPTAASLSSRTRKRLRAGRIRYLTLDYRRHGLHPELIDSVLALSTRSPNRPGFEEVDYGFDVVTPSAATFSLTWDAPEDQGESVCARHGPALTTRACTFVPLQCVGLPRSG